MFTANLIACVAWRFWSIVQTSQCAWQRMLKIWVQERTLWTNSPGYSTGHQICRINLNFEHFFVLVWILAYFPVMVFCSYFIADKTISSKKQLVHHIRLHNFLKNKTECKAGNTTKGWFIRPIFWPTKLTFLSKFVLIPTSNDVWHLIACLHWMPWVTPML